MNATIDPLDLILSYRTSKTVAASDPPALVKPISESGDNSRKASLSSNYNNEDTKRHSFKSCMLPSFQSATISPSESGYTLSSILDEETSINIWDTSMDRMGCIPWDLSTDHLADDTALPTLDLCQDIQTTSSYMRTAFSQQNSDESTAKGQVKERESTKSLLSDVKASRRRLRTASRKSKNSGEKTQSRISQTEDHQIVLAQKRARECHNRVEKQYRNKLNSQYTTLLDTIPLVSQTDSKESSSADLNESGDTPSKARNNSQGVSRGEILDAARQYIQILEQEGEKLQQEREGLLREMSNSFPSERGLGYRLQN